MLLKRIDFQEPSGLRIKIFFSRISSFSDNCTSPSSIGIIFLRKNHNKTSFFDNLPL